VPTAVSAQSLELFFSISARIVFEICKGREKTLRAVLFEELVLEEELRVVTGPILGGNKPVTFAKFAFESKRGREPKPCETDEWKKFRGVMLASRGLTLAQLEHPRRYEAVCPRSRRMRWH